jgi:Fuc2NAc and GlcNAc transferase
MDYWWLIFAVFILSFSLTNGLRKYALRRKLIDMPNARSSHSVPTPRGGGVGIVVAFLLTLPALEWAGFISGPHFLAIFGAGILVAVVGFLDDHGHIAARWRLLGHFSAAAWALYWLGGLPAVEIFGLTFNFGLLGDVLALLYLVWMLNLYNFMDGIDGVAGIEAITACLGACVLYWLSDVTELIWLPVVLAVAVSGFLYWNFPSARIFMGDAGSGFLGIVLAILSLQAAWVSSQLLWGWLILLGVFIVDATFTLLRRLIRREKVYEAHRSHAYQFASRQWGRHLPVTLAIGGLNVFWLLPIAFCVTSLGIDGAVGLVIAYAPLVFLAIKYQAGKPELKDSPSGHM